MGENSFLAHATLLADEESPLTLKKALVRSATDETVEGLQLICANVLFGKIIVTDQWKQRLRKHRLRVYALGEAKNLTTFRNLLAKAGNLNCLALILSAALDVISEGKDGGEVEEDAEPEAAGGDAPRPEAE